MNQSMLRAGQILQLSVVALLGLAVVMVHSAGMTVGTGFHVRDVLVSRHMMYAVLAVAAMLLASRVNVHHLIEVRGLRNPLPWLFLASVIMVGLTMAPHLGVTLNGARRWLRVGPITFQPSELIKWIMTLLMAWWCTTRLEVMHKFGRGLLPALVIIALACGAIVIEDLGTALLVGVVAMLVLVAGGARLWQLSLMIPPALAAVAVAIITSPYRVKRLMVFMDPWGDPQGAGYHPVQSMLAIAQGGLTGRGLGNGVQKFGYLPADTTDFVFAVICEELGLAGAAAVIALYLIILWTGLGIVRECRDTFGRLVGLAILLTVGLQALMNIAVVTVVVPTKGIALPLLSAGGTGWILTGLALGLVAAMDEAHRLESQAALSIPSEA